MAIKRLFYDLETTGVMYWKNGIHQIAGILEIDGKEVERFDLKIKPNPNCIVDDTALEVAGITREDLKSDKYESFNSGYRRFNKMIHKHVDKYNKKDKIFLIGYNNASFDNQFLRAFYVQNNDNYFGSLFWQFPIDVYVLASDCIMDKLHTLENGKLMTMCRAFGIEVDDSKLHDALYDIELTKELYERVQDERRKQVIQILNDELNRSFSEGDGKPF